MNWEDLETDSVQQILSHWQKLGQFRKKHPSIGSGKHNLLSDMPYTFSRENDEDKVIVGLDLENGPKTIAVEGVFSDGVELTDFYSNKKSIVANGVVTIDSPFKTVLLER